jgi:hypothetical protein
MTIINWISVSITAVMVCVTVALKLYYRKKLKDLDGFMGFVPPDKKDINDTT